MNQETAKILNSVENFKQNEQIVVSQLHLILGDVVRQLPVKQVKQVIYGNLTDLKNYYIQQRLPFNVYQMNKDIVEYSIQQLSEYVQQTFTSPPQFEKMETQQQTPEIPQTPQKENPISMIPEATKTAQSETQKEISDKFQQLQQERQYEGFIPMTNQQQGQDNLDTRVFQQVDYSRPNFQISNMNTNTNTNQTNIELTKEEQAQMNPEEKEAILRQTEMDFQNRLTLMDQQNAAFFNQQNAVEQAMNPSSDPNAIGSGGGLEDILKPSIPPKLVKTLRYVALYSGNRDYLAYPNRFDYSITLEREITNVKKIKILKLVLPNEIDQRRYIETSTQTHIENLRDYFQNNNYAYEQMVFIDIKNINNLNRNNAPDQYQTVATVFQGQNEIFRGRNTKIYGNASSENIDYGGGVLERLQQFQIELRNPVGDMYKNNQLDNYKMVDIIGAQVNDISNPINATVTEFNTLQIAIDKPFEVNQFFMGDYVRFTQTTITVLGNDGEPYTLNSNGEYTLTAAAQAAAGSPSNYQSYAATQINATGNYTTGEISLVMNFFNNNSGYQIVEVYQHLNNVSNSFFIQLPATIINPGGTYTSIPEYSYDSALLSAFNKLKADGGFNANVSSSIINLSLQHTIVIELEQETTEIDNSQLQL